MDGVLLVRPDTSLDLNSSLAIIPEHVRRSSVSALDRNVLFHRQAAALVNCLFTQCIEQFTIYHDDIVIISNKLENFVKYVKLALNVGHHRNLFLGGPAMCFIAPKLNPFHCICGIRIDAERADSVFNWEVSANRNLLCEFWGSPVKRWLLDYSGQPQKSNQNPHTHKINQKEFFATKTSKSIIGVWYIRCIDLTLCSCFNVQ